MANDCSNKLTVTGEPGAVARFVEEVKGEARESSFAFREPEEGEAQPLSLAKIVPGRPEFDGTQEPEPEAWVWSREHWSTDSDAYFFDPPEVESGCVVYKFSTRWTPPVEVVKAAAERWPELRFALSFFEPNMKFTGRLTCGGGGPVEEVAAELRSRDGVEAVESMDDFEWRLHIGDTDEVRIPAAVTGGMVNMVEIVAAMHQIEDPEEKEERERA